MQSRVKSEARPAVLLLGFSLLVSTCAHGAAAQEGSKGIQPEQAGIGNRPQPRIGGAKQRRRRQTYRTSRRFNPARPQAGQESALLGVTLWRFRPATGADQAKELVDEGEGGASREWTLERIEVGTPLAVGQRIRLSIESLSHKGYLYVVDREQYADDSKGAARLIFPTLRTRGGNNYVEPGQLIDIPAAPRYFNIRQSTPGRTQVAELLTLLVTRKPLDLPSPVGERAMTLPDELLADWERRWKTEAIELELEGGAGQAMTTREQAVGAGNAKDLVDEETEELTQEDPLPQTVYRTTIKRGEALLLTVPLRIKSATGRGSLRGQNRAPWRSGRVGGLALSGPAAARRARSSRPRGSAARPGSASCSSSSPRRSPAVASCS